MAIQGSRQNEQMTKGNGTQLVTAESRRADLEACWTEWQALV